MRPEQSPAATRAVHELDIAALSGARDFAGTGKRGKVTVCFDEGFEYRQRVENESAAYRLTVMPPIAFFQIVAGHVPPGFPYFYRSRAFRVV